MNIIYQYIVNKLSKESLFVYDIDVIRDSFERLNYTRRGQFIGKPTYGCGILDLVYEPL